MVYRIFNWWTSNIRSSLLPHNISIKVRKLSKGHKNLKRKFEIYLVNIKSSGRLFQNLWPSQKTQTLLIQKLLQSTVTGYAQDSYLLLNLHTCSRSTVSRNFIWIFEIIFYHEQPLLWQYGLWSFQTGYTKLERFLHKKQYIQRKLLNFENWISGGPRSFRKSEF